MHIQQGHTLPKWELGKRQPVFLSQKLIDKVWWTKTR